MASNTQLLKQPKKVVSMFGWLTDVRVKKAALMLDSTLRQAEEKRSKIGIEAMVDHFLHHPHLCSRDGDKSLGIFKLSDPLDGLAFFVRRDASPDHRSPIMVRGYSDLYTSFVLTTEYHAGANDYLVSIQPSPHGQIGSLARPLAKRIIRYYGAIDLLEAAKPPRPL